MKQAIYYCIYEQQGEAVITAGKIDIKLWHDEKAETDKLLLSKQGRTLHRNDAGDLR
jgi:hypothetical protein